MGTNCQREDVPGLSDGYPLYSKDGMIIRYHPEGRKWLVADKEHKGTTCLAYAEAMDTLHPGYAQLQLVETSEIEPLRDSCFPALARTTQAVAFLGC